MSAQTTTRTAAAAGGDPDGTAAGNRIAFQNVSVAYGGLTVLSNLTLTVNPGEIVALIGPSGSGKTTALRAVAGFVRPAGGRIFIGEREVTHMPPHARNIGMVVQNYALFPHMRVEENVAFGLRAKGAPEALIRERVPQALAMVGMDGFARRYPRELSGGQQQRVAIARALAIRPQVLLLDEPLSALDAQIRLSMLDELQKLHEELPDLTVLYVTHDQVEALTLANHIGIMRGGRLVAFGAAQQLFRHPPNRFAAEFLGRANLLPVTNLRPSEQAETGKDGVELARVEFAGTVLRARNHHGLGRGRACLICVRPHDFRPGPGPEGVNRLTGTVESVQWQGNVHNITFTAGGVSLRMTSAPLSEPPRPGAALEVHFDPAEVTLVPEDRDSEGAGEGAGGGGGHG